ncbi:MAG: TIGR02646 family protein [Candidatus Parabeggiatoa sp. nov. 3]|mgnify:CR=1 FL=1|nr:MAG: TIGR02646 family protein [Gammaproteobacteria bacterium]RKZ61458.1 MAG: TIGR02646 family protein [Gammaproteobacteria bacterium]
MMKFTRSAAPKCLKKYKQWGREYTRKRPSKFYWHRYQNRSVHEIVLAELESLTANHCSFCDGYPLGAQSRQTIEHFRPKSKYPRLAYVWQNLFLSCDVCQNAKGENYDKKLLKPDAIGYAFNRYFKIKAKTGEIVINLAASPDDQERAKITLEMYDLNSTVRKSSRIKQLQLKYMFKYRKRGIANDDLDNLAYRFLFI